MKSAEEIMEILEAYDLTGSSRSAAELADCPHHTVTRYFEVREALLALGYTGSERTTRRAVAVVRRAYRAGRVRGYTGRGRPSRGCGCSTTTATARSWVV